MTTIAVTTDRTVDPAQSRRAELSAFLKTRRERLKPSDVGLPPGSRRRTPGLRREEVAQLAGVGVTWYTWLEQGRQINASSQVIGAIARTLKLDRHEWAHLSTLAGIPQVPAPDKCAALPPNTQQILDQLSPFPAVALNERMDLLAYNDAFATFVIPLDEIAREDRNLMWLVFTDTAWQCSVDGIEEQAARLVAAFRSAMANHLGEPAWVTLVDRLLEASPLFAKYWERHDVAPVAQRVKVIESPRLGVMRFMTTSMWLTQQGVARIVTYTPMDEQTATKLTSLTGAPCLALAAV